MSAASHLVMTEGDPSLSEEPSEPPGSEPPPHLRPISHLLTPLGAVVCSCDGLSSTVRRTATRNTASLRMLRKESAKEIVKFLRSPCHQPHLSDMEISLGTLGDSNNTGSRVGQEISAIAGIVLSECLCTTCGHKRAITHTASARSLASPYRLCQISLDTTIQSGIIPVSIVGYSHCLGLTALGMF